MSEFEGWLLLLASMMCLITTGLISLRLDLAVKIGKRNAKEILKLYDHLMDIGINCIPNPEDRKRVRNEIEATRKECKACIS